MICVRGIGKMTVDAGMHCERHGEGDEVLELGTPDSAMSERYSGSESDGEEMLVEKAGPRGEVSVECPGAWR